MHEFQMENEDAWNTRHEFVILFALTGCVWLFFFLVFYPGTAMNDTIYVLFCSLLAKNISFKIDLALEILDFTVPKEHSNISAISS